MLEFSRRKTWALPDMSEADYCEILSIFKELRNAALGDEESSDVIRYKLDYGNEWLCFEVTPHSVMITLAADADEAGFPRGIIYATTELAWDYMCELIDKDPLDEDIDKEDI